VPRLPTTGRNGRSSARSHPTFGWARLASAAMTIRVSVVGAGSWGTTVAHLAAHNEPTILWSRRKDLADQINQEHENGDYLSGYRLRPDLRATSSMEEAVCEADVLVMGVP